MSAALALLRDLVATPSVSGDEAAAAELLALRMGALGLDAHVDAAGNAVGVRRGGDAPTRRLLLLGHVDTVPGEIEVRVEDGALWGRGAVDAKGPLCAFAVAAGRAALPEDVELVVVGAVEEEVASSRGAHHVAETHPAPEAVVIGEPSGWDALTLGYKGCLRARWTVSQPGGHGAGPRGAVAERAAAVWQATRAFAEALDGDEARLFGRLLPSLASIRSDSDGLTDACAMELGFRLPPGFDDAALRAAVEGADPEATVEWYGALPAHVGPRTSTLANALRGAIRGAGGTPRDLHKTGTSDMNVLGPAWGVPILAYGPGDSSLDHTPDERLDLAEYARSIDVLTAAIGRWASRRP